MLAKAFGTDEVALGVFTHRTTYLPGLLGQLAEDR